MLTSADKLLPILGHATYLVTLAAMAGINLYAGPRIGTPQMPMQWSLSGEPTWFASKAIGLWFPVSVAVLVGGALLFRARQSDPHAGNWDWIFLIVSCGLLLGIHVWHVSAVVAWAKNQP